MRPRLTARRKSATRPAECAWASERTCMSGLAESVGRPTEVGDPGMRLRLIALARAHPPHGGLPRPAHGIRRSREGRESQLPDRLRRGIRVLVFMTGEASGLYEAV